MADVFVLKPISRTAVPEAIRKAEHYRLLNEPEQAESICRDVLEADPDNQDVLIVLVLAMTDLFGRSGMGSRVQEAHEILDQLTDEYERSYYRGLVMERQARAMLGRATSRAVAYECLRDAMEHYEKAERLRPEGNDSAVLRWNTCVRTIRREQLEPPPANEPEAMLD